MTSNTAAIDSMEGIEGPSGGEDASLTADEVRILEIYQRMEELHFEITLLKQQGTLSQAGSHNDIDMQKAQEGLLEARAAYTVKSNVVSNVLVATPILKAVHAGSNASIIEQDLLPLVEKRDEASVALAQLDAKVRSAREELMRAESEHVGVARQNVDLTKTMLDLADRATKGKEDVADPKARRRMGELEVSMKTSRQRWRIMKGTASAVIVGSGKDWARDPKLLGLVLDEDDDL